MKYRCNIFAIYFCLLMITGCIQNEPEIVYDPSERIVFSYPFLMVETRSGFLDALYNGDVFGVIGYCIPYLPGTNTLSYSGASSQWSTKRSLCPPSVFYGQPIRVTSSGCSYDYESQDPMSTANNPKFWYKDGFDLDGSEESNVQNADEYLYSFFAYYPFDDWTIESPDSKTAAGAPVLKFTIPDDRDTPDAMLGVLYNQDKGTRGLQFNFYHVMTGLGFEVNNLSERELKVYSVKLKGNFFKSVSVDFTGDVVEYSFPAEYDSKEYVFIDRPDDNPMVLESSEDGTSSSDIEDIKYILLISGEDTYFGNDVKVEITYDFGNGKQTQSYTRPGTFTPTPGVRYTAQLNFVGNAFVLQFIVDNSDIWEDGENDDNDDTNDDIVFE